MTQISRILPNRRLSTIEFYLHRLRGAGEQTTSVRSEASYGNPTLPDSNPCHPRNPWLAFRPKIRVYSCLFVVTRSSEFSGTTEASRRSRRNGQKKTLDGDEAGGATSGSGAKSNR